MLIRWIDRWTRCRWLGHVPWPRDSREPTCERCGKSLADKNLVIEPVPTRTL